MDELNSSESDLALTAARVVRVGIDRELERLEATVERCRRRALELHALLQELEGFVASGKDSATILALSPE